MDVEKLKWMRKRSYIDEAIVEEQAEERGTHAGLLGDLCLHD